jgi:uncharacterized protein (AIM24 family)
MERIASFSVDHDVLVPGLYLSRRDGHVVTYELKPGQSIVVDTGNVAAYEPSVNMEIKSVPGVKNALFGGEGLFNTLLTGPGKVWIQTMPVSAVASVLRPYMPTGN